jgi:hypothetical protein
MRIKNWVCAHTALLRRMLSYRLLCGLAYCLIRRYAEHIDSADCLVCAARFHKMRIGHVLTIDMHRQWFCRKCGLMVEAWASSPKCSNVRPVSVAAPVEKRTTVIPINW